MPTTKAGKKRRLGRGLDSLLGPSSSSFPSAEAKKSGGKAGRKSLSGGSGAPGVSGRRRGRGRARLAGKTLSKGAAKAARAGLGGFDGGGASSGIAGPSSDGFGIAGGSGGATRVASSATRAAATALASSADAAAGGGLSGGNLSGGGGERALLIDIERMAPNSAQPRKRFPEKELAELADSIAKHGLLQPVLIRPLTEKEKNSAAEAALSSAPGASTRRNKKAKKSASSKRKGRRGARAAAAAAPPGPDYCIIAGERRWRAAGKAGLHKLPVIIRQARSSREEALWSLTENIQRSDLNPLEEAEAYKQLMKGRKSLTQEGLARALGRSRASVANQLRLLNLDPQVKDWLRQGRLSFSQAREILGEKSAKRQRRLAKLCMERTMTVRGIGDMQKRGAKKGGGAGKGKGGRPPAWAQSSLSELRELSARNIRLSYSKGKGALSFPFRSEKDLKRLFHALWPKS